MEFEKFFYTLFYLTFISPVFSKTFNSLENSNREVAELKWLFHVGEDENSEAENVKYTVCDTKQCRIIADEFRKAMNKSVDPCEDFYEYACGNWKSFNPMPPDQVFWGRFMQFQQMVSLRVKELLDTEPKSTDILPLRQAKKWYRSCMDTKALDERGLKPLESVLMQLGGWPMTMDREEWDENEYSWQSIEEHYFHITGSYVFYTVAPETTKRDAITLSRGKTPFSDDIEFPLKDYSGNNYGGYVKFIEEIIKSYIDEHRADVSQKIMEKDVRDLVEFEKNLFLLNIEDFESVSTTIDNFIKMYNANVTEIEDEDKEIEKIDFRRMIRRLFEFVNYDIEDSTSLYVSNGMNYWIQLTELLNNTPKRTIVNYIHWSFVSKMMKYTTENMREILWKALSDGYGVTARTPRWYECVSEMKMTAAAAYAFTQKYFDDQTEKDVREMIDHIRDEMKSQIRKTGWLDEESKELVTDKLSTMQVFLGYPDWYKNETSVLNSYKGMTIGSNHFNNILSYEKYKMKRKLRGLPVDISSMNPTTVNAFYRYSQNSIELPAADFQSPLFTAKLPRNINYGIAGVVIGHEIGHGFDITGMKKGKDGNKTKIAKAIMNMYYQRAECFLHQFNKYMGVTEVANADYDDESTADYFEGMSFGRRTRGENIADSTALHSVFEAYRKMIEKIPDGDYKLPGFEEYTDNQMFFISFGAMWCGETRPELQKELEEFSDHSPARLRVIGSVSNTNDFARAFNCPIGSPMNPENKCDIWKSSQKHINRGKESELLLRYRLHNYKWNLNW